LVHLVHIIIILSKETEHKLINCEATVRLFCQVKNKGHAHTHTYTHQGNNSYTIPADKSVRSATETCYAYRTVSERAYDYNNNYGAYKSYTFI